MNILMQATASVLARSIRVRTPPLHATCCLSVSFVFVETLHIHYALPKPSCI